MADETEKVCMDEEYIPCGWDNSFEKIEFLWTTIYKSWNFGTSSIRFWKNMSVYKPAIYLDNMLLPDLLQAPILEFNCSITLGRE
jgi:hypothetical protein